MRELLDSHHTAPHPRQPFKGDGWSADVTESERADECGKAVRNRWRDEEELGRMAGVVETSGVCTYRLQLLQSKRAFHVRSTKPRATIP